MKVLRPSDKRMSMNPPPPRFPAEGCVTANVNPMATAASIALPPCCNTETPTAVACGSTVTTIPCRARTGSRPGEVLLPTNNASDTTHRNPRVRMLKNGQVNGRFRAVNCELRREQNQLLLFVFLP